MQIVHTIEEVRRYIRLAKKEDRTIGFVPTMGFLHEGHLSLVDISKQHSDYQVMSIFVNKMQFNDIKDFDSYPVDLERDFSLAEKQGVDLIFVPEDREMYQDNLTSVDVDMLTAHLCGAHRPGHFKGVFTVVSKLFNIIQPDVSVFGQKDIQQAVSIHKMATDLNFPVKIVIAPIVREKSGLAMSSRNKHLTDEQRERALALSRGLKKAESLLAEGEQKADTISRAIRDVVQSSNPDSIDYISIVKFSDLSPCDLVVEKTVIALAAYYGTTRLIDNMIVTFDEGKTQCVY